MRERILQTLRDEMRFVHLFVGQDEVADPAYAPAPVRLEIRNGAIVNPETVKWPPATKAWGSVTGVAFSNDGVLASGPIYPVVPAKGSDKTVQQHDMFEIGAGGLVVEVQEG